MKCSNCVYYNHDNNFCCKKMYDATLCEKNCADEDTAPKTTPINELEFAPEFVEDVPEYWTVEKLFKKLKHDEIMYGVD